ncbi:alpha/beta hydrolase [Silvibacterium acidisoli]|uniref:alpha/beta hydrolase n=1 Tax=Acidobacteriaceae bacterium ZG23-2 TaxID=2883246 RepID=UPI00406D196D
MAKQKIRQAADTQDAPIVVSGRWLLRAFALVFSVAALCAYGTLCLLFYQGQWQLLLHPSHAITDKPASRGLRFDEIHFNVNEAGVPQLAGWWIPSSAPAVSPSTPTLLYLHDGSGSLSNTVGDLASLHALGLNVFAFDYRGFGKSASITPHEATMLTDSLAAWTYLTETRHLAGSSIVLYGDGTGAALAAKLALQHEPAALIINNPSNTAGEIYARDSRTRLLPIRLLATERFDPAAALVKIHAPKLFLGPSQRTGDLYRLSAGPKTLRQPLKDFLAASSK